MQEGLEEVPHALLKLGVEVVMPLLEPWDDLRQASQQWFEPLDRPALLFRYLRIPCRQGFGLLQVVPTSPADQQRWIGVSRAERIADEALLRHVEGTTQAPAGRGLKIGRGVLGRWGISPTSSRLRRRCSAAKRSLNDSAVSSARRARVLSTSASMASSRRWRSQVCSQISRLRSPEGL